jgi:hypothetical protein
MKNKLHSKKSFSFLWSVAFSLVVSASSAFAANDGAAVAATNINNSIVDPPAMGLTVTGPASITNFSISYAASASPDQYRFKVKNLTTNAEVISAAQNSQYYSIPASLRAWSTSFEISAEAVIGGVGQGYGAVFNATSVGIPSISMAPTTCGITLSSFSQSISCNVAPINATLYRLRLRLASTPGGPYFYATTTTRFVRLTDFVGLTLQFNETYAISAQYDMTNNAAPLTSAYGVECDVTSPTFVSTFAGAPYTICAGQASPLPTMSDQGDIGTWSPAFDANNSGTYNFTANGQPATSATTTVTVTPQPVWFQDADGDGFGNPMMSLSSCTMPIGYVTDNTDCNDMSVAVNPAATEVCWNNIDDNCDGVKSESCGIVPVFLNLPPGGIVTNLATHMSAIQYYVDAIPVSNLHYRYEFTNLTTNAVVEFDKTDVFSRYFTIPLSIRAHNTMYNIRAAAIINGEPQAYAGPSITVTTGPAPTVKLIASSCNATLSNINSTIVSATGFSATNYEFRMRVASSMDPYVFATSSNRYLSFGAFAGVQAGTTYEVSVRYSFVNNLMTETSAWGDVCFVTTPGAMPIPRDLVQGDSLTEFTAVAYPNPFNDGFQLNVKSGQSSEVSVTVFDMVGRMIEARSSKASQLESLTIGSNYPAGVYNVIVTQGAEKKTVRVIKR